MHSLVLGFSMCCALRGGRGVREMECCWLGVSFKTFSSSLSWLGSAWEGGKEGGREGGREGGSKRARKKSPSCIRKMLQY